MKKLLIIIALVVVSAVPFAQEEEKRDAGKKLIADMFEIHPKSLKKSSEIQYNKKGEPYYFFTLFDLSLSVSSDTATVLDCSGVVVAKAVSNAEEDLTPEKEDNNMWGMYRTGFRPRGMKLEAYTEKYGFPVNVKLKTPEKDTDGIKHIKGFVMVTYSTGSHAQVFSLSDDLAGEEIKIGGSDIRIQVVSCDENELKFKITNNDLRLFRKVAFLDKDKKPVRKMGHSATGDGKQKTFTYRLKGSDASFFSVSFHKGSAMISVPFEFKDITLDPSRVPERPKLKTHWGPKNNKQKKINPKPELKEEKVDHIF